MQSRLDLCASATRSVVRLRQRFCVPVLIRNRVSPGCLMFCDMKTSSKRNIWTVFFFKRILIARDKNLQTEQAVFTLFLNKQTVIYTDQQKTNTSSWVYKVICRTCFLFILIYFINCYPVCRERHRRRTCWRVWWKHRGCFDGETKERENAGEIQTGPLWGEQRESLLSNLIGCYSCRTVAC